MSCLPTPEFPPITPYFQMRVAPLAVLPAWPPLPPLLSSGVEGADEQASRSDAIETPQTRAEVRITPLSVRATRFGSKRYGC